MNKEMVKIKTVEKKFFWRKFLILFYIEILTISFKDYVYIKQENKYTEDMPKFTS